MPVSIGQANGSRHGMTAHCADCHRGTNLDLPALIGRYGTDRQPLSLPLQCSRCGSRRVAITVYPLSAPIGIPR